MAKNLLELMEELNKLFSDASKWTQRDLARDINGKHVDPKSRSAKYWCLEGGVIKILPKYHVDERTYLRLLGILTFNLGGPNNKVKNVICFNDAPDTTFEQVKQLIEKSIAWLKETESKGIVLNPV